MLSGNRNFEARIHPNLKANFLASPPLVVAFALAGTVLDLDDRAARHGQGRQAGVPEGHLADVARDRAVLPVARDPETFRRLYGDFANANPMWKEIAGADGQVYDWPRSTYIAKPPFFEASRCAGGRPADIVGARACWASSATR